MEVLLYYGGSTVLNNYVRTYIILLTKRMIIMKCACMLINLIFEVDYSRSINEF